MSKPTTIEKNNRFYEQPNGEILTENEQLKEWLVIANKENERLNKCYCERTDCAGRIKNSAKFNSIEEENERLNNIINELEKDIDNYDVFKEFSFPLMKRWEEEQVKSSINYEWRKAIKEPFLNKIKELKEVDKGE